MGAKREIPEPSLDREVDRVVKLLRKDAEEEQDDNKSSQQRSQRRTKSVDDVS